MTPRERAAAYNAAFPDRPPLAATDRWVYGIWLIGNNYRNKSRLYGAYPPDYLKRVRTLYSDVFSLARPRVLHLCKGTVESDGPLPGIGLDINPAHRPEIVGDAQKIPIRDAVFDLICADVPYGPKHALRYGFPMLDRKKVMHEAARVTKPGGHLVWLDTKKPMFTKAEWHQYGTIGVERSTNHDIRGVWLFERVA